GPSRNILRHLQQGFTTREMGSDVILRGNNPQDRMSALECAEQASSRAWTVKAPHIASLTTKAFFGKCQTSFRGAASAIDDPPMTQRRSRQDVGQGADNQRRDKAD